MRQAENEMFRGATMIRAMRTEGYAVAINAAGTNQAVLA